MFRNHYLALIKFVLIFQLALIIGTEQIKYRPTNDDCLAKVNQLRT